MGKRWISVKECAVYLGLHSKTIYKLVGYGVIPSTKLAGSVGIDRQRLDELLESQEKDIESMLKDWL